MKAYNTKLHKGNICKTLFDLHSSRFRLKKGKQSLVRIFFLRILHSLNSSRINNRTITSRIKSLWGARGDIFYRDLPDKLCEIQFKRVMFVSLLRHHSTPAYKLCRSTEQLKYRCLTYLPPIKILVLALLWVSDHDLGDLVICSTMNGFSLKKLFSKEKSTAQSRILLRKNRFCMRQLTRFARLNK